MHINVESKENHAVLHLRGEFDTYYCRLLQEEIDAQLAAGVNRIVLNLRLVKFINSTALGAIIKSSKALSAKKGRLVISRPSGFCRDIIEKVGVNRVVPIYDSDEDAARGLLEGAEPASSRAEAQREEDESAVLFAPADTGRLEHFLSASRFFKSETAGAPSQPPRPTGANWNGVGRMSSLDDKGLHFTWNGGDTGLDPFAMGQLLSIGTAVRVKFRLPLFKPGYCEAQATVTEVEERSDGVKIGASFSKIDDKTLQAVRQYAADLRFLKEELKKATGR